MFVVSPSSVYGIRTDDASIETIFGFNKAGVNSASTMVVYPDSDGTIVLAETGTKGSAKLCRYISCDPSELENIPVVTVGAMYNPYIVSEYISEWNDSQTDYRVELKMYIENENYGTEEYNEIMDAFREDALAGELPDILITDSAGMLEDIDLREMGALCDLNEMMENDDALTRDMFVPNVLKSYETDDGGVYAISNYFQANFGYVGKEKYLGDIENWNLEAFMETVRSLPEGMKIDEHDSTDTKFGRLSFIDVIDYFIDFEEMTCDFDNPLFIEFLRFCNEAPLEAEQQLNPSEEMSDEEWMEFWRNLERVYLDDNALLYNLSYVGYQEHLINTKGRFGGDEIVYLGDISEENQHGSVDLCPDHFAISANSPNKEYAWDFISSMFTDDYYAGHTVSYTEEGSSMQGGFPVTKSGLDVLAENEMVDRFNHDTDYKGVYYTIGDEYIEIGSVTQEIVDEVNEMIYALEPVGRSVGTNMRGDLYTMIYEEVNRCFNGECTEEDCSRFLQDIVSTYLAEHS